VQHGSDKQIVGYISRDPDADGSATVLADGTIGARPDGPAAVGLSAWEELVGAMPDEHAQLLNLTHSWLRSVLPHVICRVGRVHYGLLADAGSAPGEPAASYSAGGGAAAVLHARQLLAVPFVGKDVPSHAAEFSHPDALIGLTILAYRHEGLRWEDMRGLFTLLLETMGQEGGPFRERPSCRMYATWVELAGGHVRGAARVGGSGGVNRTAGGRGEAAGRALLGDEPEELLVDLGEGSRDGGGAAATAQAQHDV